MAEASGLVDMCRKLTGEECIDVYPDWTIGRKPWADPPYFENAATKICGVTPAHLGILTAVPAAWSLTAPKPDYPDALRAELAWKLAREKDFDKAVHIASGIVNPNRRAESLTELALLQIKRGMVRDARATLVRAVAAVDEIPENFPDVPALFWLDPHDPVNVQDRAIRFARIAQVLGELLPHE